MRLRLVALAACLGALATASAAPPAQQLKGEVVRVEHYDPATVPSRGPQNALVTVELFFAPSVNNVQRLPAYRQLEALQAKHPTRIRVIYRVMQRTAQPPGPQLPTLALEAYAQGKFFEFVTAIHASRSTLTRDQMIEIGKKVGLDPQRLDKAISEDRYRDVIVANERRLERLRGTTAPMVFFNDKPMRTALSSIGEGEYETAYLDAYDRARDMIDRGVDPKQLMAAFDAEVLRSVQPLVITTGPSDDDLEGESSDHPLANPPLKLAGLPSLGSPLPGDRGSPVPVVIVCRPSSPECLLLMRSIHNAHNTYRGEIKIIWAPWFEVSRDDSAELAMLGDAALCAETNSSSPDDLDISPGWQWVIETYALIQKAHGRRIPPQKLIDDVAAKLRVESKALSTCRARLAGATLEWITEARRSGVTSSPAVVIGGRIYHGLTDPTIIQQLIEAELAPGVLGRCSTTGC
ncbi:MAG: hypothetical protein H0T46_17090 [Deltaproteobacteria bacterium]|nr:hypothetical protein [Deltaproteobacteria bacterium]